MFYTKSVGFMFQQAVYFRPWQLSGRWTWHTHTLLATLRYKSQSGSGRLKKVQELLVFSILRLELQ